MNQKQSHALYTVLANVTRFKAHHLQPMVRSGLNFLKKNGKNFSTEGGRITQLGVLIQER